MKISVHQRFILFYMVANKKKTYSGFEKKVPCTLLCLYFDDISI